MSPSSYDIPSLREEVARLREQGYAVFDLHAHTSFSDGERTPEEIVRRAHELGLSGIAITDHDCEKAYERACAEAERYGDGFIVVPGEEVSTERGHVLAYGVREKVPAGLSLRETAERVHAQGGAAVAAHPYAALGTGDALSTHLDALSQAELEALDGVEVYNASVLWPADAEGRARALAERHGLAHVAGSDSHMAWSVGLGLTLTPPVSTSDELVACILDGRTEAYRPDENERALVNAAKCAEFALAMGPRGVRYIWNQLRERVLRPEQEAQDPPEPGWKHP